MVNKNKIKGTSFEREVVDILNENLNGKFKRVPGSGAMGTSMGEGLLTGDVVGKVDGIAKSFRIECKVRSGGTQMAIKKEWLDKIREEADSTYSYPLLFCKFLGARNGTKKFIAMDLDTFFDIINELSRRGDSG